MILRRYICQRLRDYYSQPAENVVGSVSVVGDALSSPPTSSIDFSSLWGEWHWRRTYERVYKEQRGRWLTPVELFYPFYSKAFANFILESVVKFGQNEFEIVECGGGRGTNALSILDHLHDFHFDAYEALQRYTIIDTSPTLHELQRKVLKERSKHADKVDLVNVDLMDIAEGHSVFLPSSDVPTAVLAFELLDNLPHDKMARCIDTGNVLQAQVSADGMKSSHVDTSLEYVETYSPLSDPLLKRISEVRPSLYTPLASQGPRWVPSVALGFLMRLYECRPNSSVAFADFDWLPPADVGTIPARQDSDILMAEPAIGDPIVTDMSGKDHPCYLTSPPDAPCDILYPTDFGRLAAFASGLLSTDGLACQHMKQSEFLLRYGNAEVNRTRGYTGYSPMIHDFGNTSVFITSKA